MPDQIEIRSLTPEDDLTEAEDLQRRIWTGSETDIIPIHLLVALIHNGGMVLGAFDQERLVGLLTGFLGAYTDNNERHAIKHASHSLGVDPEYRDKHIGFRMKAMQRELSLQNGIRLVTWSYDPLQSRNANLNIRRLGAVCQHYYVNYYGDMRDGINVGHPSDRFKAEWWITSNRVVERMEGQRGALDLAHFIAGGARSVNSATLGKNNFPHPSESPAALEGAVILMEIPPDIHALREHDADLALAWRMHTRELFEKAFGKGYLVTDFIYLKGEKIPRSYYVLSHGAGTLG